MRASLLAEYGVRLSVPGCGVLELADLVAYLPPGCALWRAAGGPLAWSDEVQMLARVEHGVRVLAWMKTEAGSKGQNPPKPVEPPPPAGQVAQEEAQESARADAYMAGRKRRAERASGVSEGADDGRT